ncbi:MAG: hypothetical protein KAT43_06105 [Nanoarchaeota archaeon]|nr:hypothetical protein [Nanoarchaeota archaeon]
MGRFSRYLKSERYGFRERMNIYAGMLIGPALGTTLMYSFLSVHSSEAKSLGDYALRLGIAAAMNVPLLFQETCGGLVVGILEANRLKRSRRVAETNFDRLVDKEFAEVNGAA